MDLKKVTDDFSVAPQIEADDFKELARLGFRSVVNNRPDGEAPGQMSASEARAAAQAAGLAYVYAPFVGPPSEEAIKALDELKSGSGPALAYCRSGTRSITAWAIHAARSKKLDPDAILQAVRNAGYNLDGMKEFLRNLQSGY
jgi:uncharacterized protein (TIGR01244 family)